MKKTNHETDPLLMEIVHQLKKRRVELSMSQRQLSEQTGVGQKNISRIENGLDAPTLTTLFKLLQPLGMGVQLTKLVNTQTDRS